ncbi:MAG: polysaccharide deacetylase family protein [Deltaproteobacteria bacterium]|nr:polysaccharide deacetylase family protein [Deltaproteobacteria bacterium]
MALLCGPAYAGGKQEQIALFQQKNITHSGLRGTHTVALTFDDGPNAATLSVMSALKAQNVPATFFIVGRMAKSHPDILAQIEANGYQLANHSATHPLLGKRYDRNPAMLIEQIRAVHDEIAPLMKPGEKFFFRAPYGSWRAAHAEILNADPVLRNYIGPIYWDAGGDIAFSKDGYILSSADWDCWRRGWDAAKCAKGYLREIRRKNGGVILMHCINSKAGDLVNAVVPALVEEGYRFVRIDQIPEYRQYETPNSAPTSIVAEAGGGGGAVGIARR